MLDNKATIYVHVKRAQVAQCEHTHTHTGCGPGWAVGVARSLAIVKIAAIIHVLPATEITTTTAAAQSRAEHQRRHSIEANAQNANYAMIYISIDIF